jgi:hypothetical protein
VKFVVEKKLNVSKMKKRYLIPQTIVVKIQQPLLQAVSPGKYDEVGGSNTYAPSYQGNAWDEDGEDY